MPMPASTTTNVMIPVRPFADRRGVIAEMRKLFGKEPRAKATLSPPIMIQPIKR